jgi:hypothetical protein
LTTKQEASWVLRPQFGDRQALGSLFGSVQPALSRYLRALIGPLHSDDVTQDVLVILYRKLWWLSSPDPFRPWMFRIASREAILGGVFVLVLVIFQVTHRLLMAIEVGIQR